MTRPVIGITCTNVGASPDRPAVYRLNQAYVRAVAQAGGAPVLLPASGDLDALRAAFESLDGLLFPGGADIQPETYGHPRHPNLGAVDPELDEIELALARWALAEEKPILGVCRGQQLINVAAGGTLFQDISSEIADALPHRVEPRDQLAHGIEVEPASRLAGLLGATTVEVNSLHHQAVRDVAPGFRMTARAPDGVIEGIEKPDHFFALAVQFHPEELVPGHAPSERLFLGFIAAAASR